MTTRPPYSLRSTEWLDGDDEVAMSHRVAMRLNEEDRGKPIIGIADTRSDFNPCHQGFNSMIEDLERGIRDAGGVPARFPVMSLGEDLMKPSTMLYRNLVAMELEETVRSYPIDGVVYLANCDKTVPAALMAAASTNLPSTLLLGGSRAAPDYNGAPLGTGTALWRALDNYRAGHIGSREWAELETVLRCAGPGACNTMGTASSMAIITEVLAMAVPGSACLPVGGTEIKAAAYSSGVAVVEAVQNRDLPADRITQAALDDAITVLAAIGGSTNAVIHIAAIAGRLGLDGSLPRMDRLWRRVPLLVDVEPCGSGLIHEFVEAGGVGALMGALGDLTSRGIAQSVNNSNRNAEGVIRSLSNPVAPAPVLAVVHGNLAPTGAVIKVAAASKELLQHRGRAVVFDDYRTMRRELDDPSRRYSASDILIMRNCGPRGAPGMPEWGMIPIPQELLARGVRDMVRVTDSRMSGTSFGTVVLHVSPEAGVGGLLALVRDGDEIELDLEGRELRLICDSVELREREATHSPPPDVHLRGWPKLYRDHVLQAPDGCDFDFLAAPTHKHRRFVAPTVGRS